MTKEWREYWEQEARWRAEFEDKSIVFMAHVFILCAPAWMNG